MIIANTKHSQSNMNHDYKTLNQIQTHLITWSNPFDNNGEDVIICITGNPGVADFYTEFGSMLYERTGMPICIIGHAGGEEVPDRKSNILHNQSHLFNLEGQIAHKLDLIKVIDKKSKIHLIGHSIGAWMILNAIRKDKNLIRRIASVNLLFPTMQRMAESKNGTFLNNVTRKIHWLVMFLVHLVFLVPEYIRLKLIRWYLTFNTYSSSFEISVIKFLNPRVIEKVLHLAYDEMDRVTNLDKEVLRDIKKITNVIYGSKDDWAPVSYMDDLKEFEPHMQLKKVDIDHGFVLKSSEPIAEMVSCFIRGKVTT